MRRFRQHSLTAHDNIKELYKLGFSRLCKIDIILGDQFMLLTLSLLHRSFFCGCHLIPLCTLRRVVCEIYRDVIEVSSVVGMHPTES